MSTLLKYRLSVLLFVFFFVMVLAGLATRPLPLPESIMPLVCSFWCGVVLRDVLRYRSQLRREEGLAEMVRISQETGQYDSNNVNPLVKP